MKGLQDNWQIVKLGQVVKLRGETTIPTPDTDLPYIGLEHIDSGAGRITQYGSSSDVVSSKSVFLAGDVLYSKLRPYLNKCILAEFGGLATTELLVIVPLEVANAGFILNLMHTSEFIAYAISNTGGTNLPRVRWTALNQYQFALPPLTEQRAIAATLQVIKEAKNIRSNELALERERKKALMEFLFNHGTRGDVLHETNELGKKPCSWRIVRLESVVDMKYGFQTSIPATAPPNGVRIISTAEIKNDGLLELSKIRTVEIEPRLVDGYLVHKNDILFNWRNSQEHVGKTALVDFEPEEPTIYASFIIRIRTHEDEARFQFFHHLMTYLRNSGLFFRLSRRAVGQANFNGSELGALLIALPEPEEQDEIIGVLGACDEKIAALESEVAHLDELFRAMLEELMSGRLSTLELVEITTPQVL